MPLPFLSEGVITELDGSELATIRCTVWPIDGEPAATPLGESYDSEGECEPAAGEDLIRQSGNRRLTVEGVTYGVIGAVRHEFLPHVRVFLREIRGS